MPILLILSVDTADVLRTAIDWYGRVLEISLSIIENGQMCNKYQTIRCAHFIAALITIILLVWGRKSEIWISLGDNINMENEKASVHVSTPNRFIAIKIGRMWNKSKLSSEVLNYMDLNEILAKKETNENIISTVSPKGGFFIWISM